MKKFIKIFLILISFNLMASQIALKKGESKIFTTNENIGIVFTSDPKVIDYEVIGAKKVVVFATGNGNASVKIFGIDNEKTLINADFIVDPVAGDLDSIAKLIESKNPGSKIKIDRLAIAGEKGYIISGEVPNEKAKDIAYNMAAVALGLSIKTQEVEQDSANSTTGDSKNSSNDNSISFLERVKSENLINRLRLPKKNKVKVELMVADVEKELIQTLGIDFNGGIFRVPLLQAQGGLKPSMGAIQTFSLNSIVEAIKNDNVAKILAKPSLTVLSGEKASFEVTNQYTPFSNVIDVNGNVATTPGTPIPYGISMAITPKVERDDKIKLTISQEVSNIHSIAKYNSMEAPNIKTRKTETVIELANGESFILSGLIDEKENEIVSSVPFLGDIPFIGAAFRKSTIKKTKSELIVIATVKLVDSIKHDETYVIPVFKTRSLIESLTNVTFNGSEEKTADEFLSNINFIEWGKKWVF